MPLRYTMTRPSAASDWTCVVVVAQPSEQTAPRKPRDIAYRRMGSFADGGLHRSCHDAGSTERSDEHGDAAHLSASGWTCVRPGDHRLSRGRASGLVSATGLPSSGLPLLQSFEDSANDLGERLVPIGPKNDGAPILR